MRTFSALLACVALAAAALLLRDRPAPRERPLDGLGEGAIRRLELSAGAESVALERRAGEWSCPDGAVDGAAVAGLVSALAQLTIDSRVGSGAAARKDYGLEERDATRVRVFLADRPAAGFDAFFGGTALGPSSLYLRFPGRPEIYLARGPAEALRRPPAGYLKEKK